MEIIWESRNERKRSKNRWNKIYVSQHLMNFTYSHVFLLHRRPLLFSQRITVNKKIEKKIYYFSIIFSNLKIRSLFRFFRSKESVCSLEEKKINLIRLRTIVKKKKRVNIFKQFLLHFAFFLLNENVENLILLFVFMQKIIRENFFFNLIWMKACHSCTLWDFVSKTKEKKTNLFRNCDKKLEYTKN